MNPSATTSKITALVWVHLYPMIMMAIIFILSPLFLIGLFYGEIANTYFITSYEKTIFTYLPVLGIVALVGMGIYIIFTLVSKLKEDTIIVETTLDKPSSHKDYFYTGLIPYNKSFWNMPTPLSASRWLITTSDAYRHLRIDAFSLRKLNLGDKVRLTIYPTLRIIKSIEFINE